MYDRIMNKIVSKLPGILQILFMERVNQIVHEAMQEESEVLLPEEEESIRTWRQHRLLDIVRTLWLDLRAVPRAYQQVLARAKLHGSHGRAQNSSGSRWHPHVG